MELLESAERNRYNDFTLIKNLVLFQAERDLPVDTTAPSEQTQLSINHKLKGDGTVYHASGCTYN